MHIQLEVRADSTGANAIVWARSKPRMGRKVPWDAWTQYYPPPAPVDHANSCPDFTSMLAPVAVNKQWKDATKVTRSLKKAYSPHSHHARLIPEVDRREMMSFLQNGPPDLPPPHWFRLADQRSNMSRHATSAVTPSITTITTTETTPPTTTTTSNTTSILDVFDNVFASQTAVVSEHNMQYQPIGVARVRSATTACVRAQTGKRCRCWSIHHSRTNHKRCPLNPRNRNLITTPVPQPDSDSPTQRKRVRKPVTQSESDTNDTGSSDDDNTGTGTDSSDDHNTGTGTDSSDTGTDTDDCPLSHVAQEKNIHVGVSIAKYFDDELYFGHIHALPKSGEKYYEIVYNDGDEETMTHTQVLRALHTYYHYQKTK